MWSYHSATEIGDLETADGRAEVRRASRAARAIAQLGAPIGPGRARPWPGLALESQALGREARKRRFWQRVMLPAGGLLLGTPTLIAVVGVGGAMYRGELAQESAEIVSIVGFFYVATIALLILLTPLWLREYRNRVTRIKDADIRIRLDADGLHVAEAGRTVLGGTWSELVVVDLEVMQQRVQRGSQVFLQGLTLADATDRQTTLNPFAFDGGPTVLRNVLWALAEHGRLAVVGPPAARGLLGRLPGAVLPRPSEDGTAARPASSGRRATPLAYALGAIALVVLLGLGVGVAVLTPREIPRPDYRGEVADLASLAQQVGSLIDAVEAEEVVAISDLCRADFFYDVTQRVPIPEDDADALAQAIETRETAFEALSRIAGRAGMDWEEENVRLCGPSPIFFASHQLPVRDYLIMANHVIITTRLGEPVDPQIICALQFQYMNVIMSAMDADSQSATPMDSMRASSAVQLARDAVDWAVEEHGFPSLTAWMTARCH